MSLLYPKLSSIYSLLHILNLCHIPMILKVELFLILQLSRPLFSSQDLTILLFMMEKFHDLFVAFFVQVSETERRVMRGSTRVS